MDVTAENLANAQTTRGANGQPYRRKEVVLQEAPAAAFGASSRPRRRTGASGDGAARRRQGRRRSSRTRRPASASTTRATRTPTPRATSTMPNVDTGHRDGRPDQRVARLRGERHRDADGQADVHQDPGHPPLMLRSIPPSRCPGPSGRSAGRRRRAPAADTASGASGAGGGFGDMLAKLDPALEHDARTTPPAPRRRWRPARRPTRRRSSWPSSARGSPMQLASTDPHQGRRGRSRTSSTHRSSETRCRALPRHRRTCRCGPSDRRRRPPLGVLVVAFLLLRLASAPSYTTLAPASIPPRPARSPPRSTQQGIPYELRNNGTALAVVKA